MATMRSTGSISLVVIVLLIASCCASGEPSRALVQRSSLEDASAPDANHGPLDVDASFRPLELDSGPTEPSGLGAEVPLPVLETARIDRRSAYVRAAVPLPPSGLVNTSALAVRDPSGAAVPASFRPLARWGGAPTSTDRAISFVEVDFQADLSAGSQAIYRLIQGEGAPTPRVTVQEADSSLIVDTGAARFTVPTNTLALLSRVELADGTVMLEQPARWVADGHVVAGRARAEVVRQGDLVAEVLIRGALREGFGITTRLRFVHGEAAARISVRVENRNRCEADDEGQPTCDDIGSPGSISFEDLSFRLRPAIALNGPSWLDGDDGPRELASGAAVTLYQDSAGHEHWDALQGYGRRLQASVRQRGAVITVAGEPRPGPRQSTGWLDVGGSSGRVTLGVAAFWQNFPKALRRDEDGEVEIGLFPGEFAVEHQLRAGEWKTHDLILRFHRDGREAARVAAIDLLDPLHSTAPVEWFARTLAAGPVGPRAPEVLSDYEQYIDCQLSTCPAARTTSDQVAGRNLYEVLERFDVYGYLDYGDIPTDFENGRSPYNLKYDVIRGMFFQYLATWDERWWNLGLAAARHSAEVDVLHAERRGFDGARRWYEGGAYGHSRHDEDSRRNPHRNHGRPHPMFAFGTPGVLLGALLTGDPMLREAGLEMAENLYWRLRNSVHEGACGSRIRRACEPRGECHGWASWSNERVNANYLNTFLWAFRVTGDRRWWEILEEGVAYQECTDAAGQDLVDRLHFQAAAYRAIGEYQLLRRNLGLSDDPNATRALRRRWEQLSSPPVFERVGDDGAIIVHSMDGAEAREHNNWVLSVADVIAYAAVLEDDWALFQRAALPLARTGGRDPFYEGDRMHYHSAKELVNAVGYGQVVRYALWLRGEH